MKGSTLLTVARVAAMVLAGLALLAAYDTAVLVSHTVDDPSAGKVIACVVSAAVSAGLGWAAARKWRRGSAPPDAAA